MANEIRTSQCFLLWVCSCFWFSLGPKEDEEAFPRRLVIGEDDNKTSTSLFQAERVGRNEDKWNGIWWTYALEVVHVGASPSYQLENLFGHCCFAMLLIKFFLRYSLCPGVLGSIRVAAWPRQLVSGHELFPRPFLSSNQRSISNRIFN
jgi:hypothetical protein